MARDPFMVRMGMRRRPDETLSILSASGQLIDLSSASAITATLRRRDRWQYQALDALEACGELSYCMFVLSGLMSRLTLFAAEFPPESDSDPIRTDNPKVISTVNRLGTPLERSEIQRELTTGLLVPAECYLVCLQPGEKRPNTKELWEIRSIDEVEESGSSVILRDSPEDENPIHLDQSRGDTFIRIWRRHPRWKSKAFSPIKPLLDDIDQLLWWKAAGSAAAKNRLTLAGALGIPQNLETPAESEDDARLSGSDRFVKRIYNAAIAAITNPGSGPASIPIFYTYPPNDSGKSGLDYLSMDRPQDDFLENRINQITETVTRGLPLPPEMVKGLGGATHWGGSQIEECLAPETRVLTADLRWVPVGDLKQDDELTAFTAEPVGTTGRWWEKARVEKVGRATLPCYEVTTADGTKFVASANHQWLIRSLNHKARWVTTEWLAEKQTALHHRITATGLLKAIEPWEADESRGAGYLAGVFDGEGYISKATPLALGFGQRENECLRTTEILTAERGFDFRRYDPLSASVNGDVFAPILRGGVKEIMRFLGQIRPPRLMARWEEYGGPDSLGSFKAKEVSISSVEFVGLREVVTLGTSTGTVIAEGYAHHNSVFREHVEPTAVLLVSSLTTAFLHPILRKMGVPDPERYLIWYDNSNLIVHRDMGQAADKGFEYGLVSPAAWRRERGFNERDAPSEAEKAEMLEWLKGLRGRDEIQPRDTITPVSSDPNKAPQQNPPGDRTPEGEDRGPGMKGKGQPILSSANSPNGHSPELISRLQVFSDATIRRALERAGNKLRSRAAKFPEYRKTLTSVPGESVAAHLGPKLVEKLDTSDLFDGCFNYVPGRVEFIVHNTLPDSRLHTLAASSALATLMHETCKLHLYNPPTAEYLISESDLETVVSKLTGEK